MTPLMINRHKTTINFTQQFLKNNYKVLDLGVENELCSYFLSMGANMTNTSGEDLDLNNDLESKYGRFDMITAFEILEHLVSPFELLRNLPSDRLIASIPLRLWFAPAYRSKTDPWDRHFHEFEDWQFDWLLEKAGWEIKAREKWISKSKKIGFRPLLRSLT
ncbi:MAG: methyltransferase, partial [Bacteroidia bacterium]